MRAPSNSVTFRQFRCDRALVSEIESIRRYSSGDLFGYLALHVQVEQEASENAGSGKLLGVARLNLGGYFCADRLRESLVTVGNEAFIRHGDSP